MKTFSSPHPSYSVSNQQFIFPLFIDKLHVKKIEFYFDNLNEIFKLPKVYNINYDDKILKDHKILFSGQIEFNYKKIINWLNGELLSSIENIDTFKKFPMIILGPKYSKDKLSKAKNFKYKVITEIQFRLFLISNIIKIEK